MPPGWLPGALDWFGIRGQTSDYHGWICHLTCMRGVPQDELEKLAHTKNTWVIFKWLLSRNNSKSVASIVNKWKIFCFFSSFLFPTVGSTDLDFCLFFSPPNALSPCSHFSSEIIKSGCLYSQFNLQEFEKTPVTFCTATEKKIRTSQLSIPLKCK